MRKTRSLTRKETAVIERDLTAAEAACSPMERRFCHWMMQLPPKRGFRIQAAKLSGYKQTSAHNLNSIVHDLLTRQRVVDLIADLTKKQIRSSAPEAVAAVKDILGDPAHRDRLKAANVVLERVDPTVQKFEVTHKRELSPDEQDLRDLRRLRDDEGYTREQLVRFFGTAGLDRVEQLEALAATKEAKVIDGEFTVIEGGENVG
jgi:hypothetical protein